MSVKIKAILLPTYPPTSLPTYIPSDPHISLPTQPPTYLPIDYSLATYLPTSLLTYLPPFPPIYIPTYLPSSLPTCPPTSLAHPPTHQRTYLPPYLASPTHPPVGVHSCSQGVQVQIKFPQPSPNPQAIPQGSYLHLQTVTVDLWAPSKCLPFDYYKGFLGAEVSHKTLKYRMKREPNRRS